MTAPVNHRGGRQADTGQVRQQDPEPGGRVPRPVLPVPRFAGHGPYAIRLPALSSPVQQGVAALVLYMAVWIPGWALPVLQHAHLAQLDQGSQDPNFYTWSLAWWPYAVAHGLNPLYSYVIGAPHGFPMAWATTIPPLALVAAPLTLVAGAVTSLNVLAALAPAVCAWAAFLACRRLTGRFWAALLGGACYGFSAYEINHTPAAQLNLSWSLLLPVLVYLVLLWRDKKLSRGWFVALVALTMLAQFFLFLETFFEMTVILAIGLPIGYALAGRTARPVVARLARQLAAAYALVIVVVFPYIAYLLIHQQQGFNRSPVGLDLAAMVTPRPSQTFGLSWLLHYSHSLRPQSYAGYVGIPALLLVLALAIWTWRSRLTRFLVLMFVVIVALAAGPTLIVSGTHVTPMPWSRLWFLSIARSAIPNRFMVFGALALAAMVTVWLAAPLRTWWVRSARWLVGLLAVAALLADVPTIANASPSPRIPMPSFITAGTYRHYIKPGEIVLVISMRGNAAMLFQADTDFYMRVAGGFVNMAITPRSDLPPQVQALSHADRAIEQRFKKYLKQAGIKAILVEKSWEPLWVGVIGKMGFHGKSIGGVIFYRVGSCATGCSLASRHSGQSAG